MSSFRPLQIQLQQPSQYLVVAHPSESAQTVKFSEQKVRFRLLTGVNFGITVKMGKPMEAFQIGSSFPQSSGERKEKMQRVLSVNYDLRSKTDPDYEGLEEELKNSPAWWHTWSQPGSSRRTNPRMNS
jgi:hypothetical protein